MNNQEKGFLNNFRKYFVAYLVTFIISFVVGAIIFLLVFLLGPNQMTFIGALDGLTIAFLCLLGISGLGFVTNQGMFDSLSYGVSQVATSMFHKQANKMNDYQGYLEKKRMIRASSPNYYMAILFSSIPYLIATIVMFILSKTLF